MCNIAFWCENCELWICRTCKKIHAKTKEMKEHKMSSLREKELEIKQKAEAAFEATKQRVSEVSKGAV